MIYIAHRGNMFGPNLARENSPEYIAEAVNAGFDVEIDVWFINGKFMLGHDEPKYDFDSSILPNKKLWCHAKNSDAFFLLKKMGARCFWHDKDAYTFTSDGKIWANIGQTLTGQGIAVVSGRGIPEFPVEGVCSDYVAELKP